MKREIIIALASLLCTVGKAETPRETVTLAWDPSPLPNVIQYNVYDHGVLLATEADSVSVVRVARDAAHDFTVTAVTFAGLESALSNDATLSPSLAFSPEDEKIQSPALVEVDSFVRQLNTDLEGFWGVEGAIDRQDWLEGDRDSWLAGVDLSGIALSGWVWNHYPGNNICADMTLISPSFALSATHICGTSWIGDPVTFVGSDGRAYTNLVASIATLGDIDLIGFAKPFPPTVHPMKFFPPWYSQFTDFVGAQCVWYRNNTAHLTVCDLPGGIQYGWWDAVGRVPGCSFQEPLGTSGDSGAPLFCIYRGEPVLCAVVAAPNPAGIFLSQPGILIWLEQQIFPESYQFINPVSVVEKP